MKCTCLIVGGAICLNCICSDEMSLKDKIDSLNNMGEAAQIMMSVSGATGTASSAVVDITPYAIVEKKYIDMDILVDDKDNEFTF